VAANQAVVGKGEYLTNCASCHGTTGTGGGPVAASLNIKVTDLTQLAKKQWWRVPIGQSVYRY
jgi:cytochrome c553